MNEASSLVIRSAFVVACAAFVAIDGGIGQAQQPPAGRTDGARGGGLGGVPLGDGPWEFGADAARYRVSVVTKALDHPWGIAFLPDGDLLVTERAGRLRVVRKGVLDPTPIGPLPAMAIAGLGGLLDVTLHPDFAQNRLIYLSYSKPGKTWGETVNGRRSQDATTAVYRAKWDGGSTLTDGKDIWVADAWHGGPDAPRGIGPATGSYGTRIVFDKDGMMFVSLGDRNYPPSSQDMSSHIGKIVRLRDDGSVPPDNPFVGKPGVKPEIWTSGHRNPLGLYIHPVTQELWSTEQGPQGGDELNLIEKGKNYGWPLASLGRNYDGTIVGHGFTAPGIVDPVVYWTPAIAISGLSFYNGDRFPAWQGNAFAGAMRAGTGQFVARVVFNQRGLPTGRDHSMLAELRQRIREVKPGPDGLIYVLTDETAGAILRIEPPTAPTEPASPPRTAIQDPVRIDGGQISGVTLPSGVRTFKGIPFAAPPVGRLRWRAPQPVVRWDGVRKAEQFASPCMQRPAPQRQPVNVTIDLPDSPKPSEDCLFLNVWTQADRANERRPGMVWIYGGAYTEGGGNSPYNDGENLAKKGVVVVNFNYRLGALGFFSHPELTKESGGKAAGNQALLDAIAALTWVKNNIAAFGGDPNNVTIFGQSAGAAIVGMLTGSPIARGLFQKGIAQSGAWMGLGLARMTPLAEAEAVGLSGRGGPPAGAPPAAPPTRALAELRALPAEQALASGRGWPIIDGHVIPEDLSITFAQGRQNPVDVIVGFNKDEHTSFGANDANTRLRDAMAWHMRLFAERQTTVGRKAYFYTFTHEPPHEPDARNLRATHAAEIAYVFNNLHAPRIFPDRSSPRLAMASEKDRAMAERMSSYWVNFARTGDPNGRGLPQWPVFFDRNAPPYVIGDIREHPSVETLNAFDAEYAKLLADLGVR